MFRDLEKDGSCVSVVASENDAYTSSGPHSLSTLPKTGRSRTIYGFIWGVARVVLLKDV